MHSIETHTYTHTTSTTTTRLKDDPKALGEMNAKAKYET